MSTGRHHRFAILSITLLSAAGFTAVCLSPAAAQEATVTVAVDAHAGQRLVPSTGIGVNDAVWDSQLGSDETADLLSGAGVKTMRYPGGSYADIYHWKDNTAPGGYVAPDTDFDTFMGSVRKVGAQPIIIANYGTGTAQEAADWVRYANRTKHYGVKYWEIGNENYGNGHYGSSWEADDHADKSPTAYADGVVKYAAAMKAVDPAIKIGAVLTTPGNWPDGITAEGDSASWNQTVLQVAGPSIDFVILHWYPGGSNAADALTKPAQAADIAEMTRAQITKYSPADAGRIQIAMTEINAGTGVNTQPGALFAADVLPALWSAGLFTVNWWNVRNGIDKVTTVAGQTDYNDFGLLSSGGCLADGTTCEPALNTPFAPYHALDLLDAFAETGDQLIQVTTSDQLVQAHAVRHRNGSLSVLLLNKDPDATRTVTLNYAGFVPAPGRPAVKSYLNGATGVTSSRAGSAQTQSLPAYSISLIRLRPAQLLSLPRAPGTPSVSALTDTAATVSWPVGPGLAPGGYDVYLQDAGTSRLAGSTSNTTLRIDGLRPGTRYTVTVVAKGSGGTESWSSAAMVFVSGTPATSTCAVNLTNTADWGNGYVGNLTVTNTGTSPIDGWTLGFDFPRSWESFGSGWNATWSVEGTKVTAANADSVLAPGASAGVGYVGNYAGPNVLPGVFTVNGSICTTT
ncbi:MAG TPA: cellulose binding domain-containing protein [Kineosporiaceae bacterium]|nr:cellulose binding domain-containing protein [Kineosporiaceae bacterium]